MTPIEFDEQTTVLAKNQPEYQPLPVHVTGDSTRTMTACWKLTWRERLNLLFTGRLWISQMTFGQPFQPQLPSVEKLV